MRSRAFIWIPKDVQRNLHRKNIWKTKRKNNRRRDYCTPNLLPYSYKDISALLFFTFEVIYLRNTYIYTETKKLIKKYGTRDPFEIMDQMNIVIGETSRYKTLKGYCFMNCKTIHSTIWRIIQNTRPICLLPICWLKMRKSNIWFRTRPSLSYADGDSEQFPGEIK